jgi:hypothetical protein
MAALQPPADLIDVVDWTSTEAVNCDSSHTLDNALKQVCCRGSHGGVGALPSAHIAFTWLRLLRLLCSGVATCTLFLLGFFSAVACRATSGACLSVCTSPTLPAHLSMLTAGHAILLLMRSPAYRVRGAPCSAAPLCVLVANVCCSSAGAAQLKVIFFRHTLRSVCRAYGALA